MNKQTILMDYVEKELMKGRNLKITVQSDLLSAGIVDSLGLLKLVAFVEDKFGRQVPDEDVVFENFYSVKALSDYLDNSMASEPVNG